MAAGAAFAAVIMLALWLTAPPRPNATRSVAAAAPARQLVHAVSPARVVPVASPVTPVADSNAALQCARPETIARLRTLIADKAQAGVRGDRLAQLVSLSVTGAPDDEAAGGTAFRCSGWLSLAAAGVAAAEPVSVTYRVERTADGRSLVSILEGTAPIVAAITTAAKRIDPAPVALATDPVQPTRRNVSVVRDQAGRFARTSFNCRRATSQVNRMICASESLAALDREMSAVFNSARDRADPSVRDALDDSRVDFLNRKQRCSSEACIARVYQERIADLEDYR